MASADSPSRRSTAGCTRSSPECGAPLPSRVRNAAAERWRREAGRRYASRGMFFESDAYEGFMGRWSRRLAPLLIDFAEVGVGQAVLDVGSGTGALTFAAA